MEEYCPVICPEEPVPDDMKCCRECGIYEHGSRMVWGEGNPNAPIMLILDNPGAREDREGIPYVCGTRQTLQKAAHQTGFRMDNLYVTYILKRRPIRAYDKEKARNTCMMHLSKQLSDKKPQMILCLGNVAVQSFFRDKEAEVKKLRGTWHDISGFSTAVAYHPLAIRRRPNLWSLFLEDWRLVAERFQQLY
ncbi:uracil-DNA glycosylase [Bacillus sp. V5-8f]|uniref:uracil-DNA glycosylase n=1 Tax=Bacillus sp. V5-8f TaxID=2053044 RepID=UPI000C769BFE|nr:uracil-DNA glycosylase [Bacillus sp. V5-8f]PLT35424.1 uracil-DNA glycosylase [Bacillus sp. V5-8f]